MHSALSYCACVWSHGLSFSELYERLTRLLGDAAKAFESASPACRARTRTRASRSLCSPRFPYTAATIRVRRGMDDQSEHGGYAKDSVYFKGSVAILRMRRKVNLMILYAGRISLSAVHKAARILGLSGVSPPASYVVAATRRGKGDADRRNGNGSGNGSGGGSGRGDGGGRGGARRRNGGGSSGRRRSLPASLAAPGDAAALNGHAPVLTKRRSLQPTRGAKAARGSKAGRGGSKAAADARGSDSPSTSTPTTEGATNASDDGGGEGSGEGSGGGSGEGSGGGSRDSSRGGCGGGDGIPEGSGNGDVDVDGDGDGDGGVRDAAESDGGKRADEEEDDDGDGDDADDDSGPKVPTKLATGAEFFDSVLLPRFMRDGAACEPPRAPHPCTCAARAA